MTSIPPQCCAVPYTLNGTLYHNCTVNPDFSDDFGCFHANGQWVKCQRPEGTSLWLFSVVKAKFHYASWFWAGSELVRSRSPTSFEPDSVMEFGFEPLCDQLRTSFELASVMEFGFKCTNYMLNKRHIQLLLRDCETRYMTVEVFPSAAQLSEKLHLKTFAIERHSRSSEMA